MGDVLDHISVAQVAQGVIMRAVSLLNIDNFDPGFRRADALILFRLGAIGRRRRFLDPSPTNELHNLIAHSQSGIHLIPHVDLVVIDGVWRVFAAGYQDSQNGLASALL